MGNSFSASNNDNVSVSSSTFEPASLQLDVLAEAELLRQQARELRSKAQETSRQSQHQYQYGSKSKAKILSQKKNALYKQVNEKDRQATELIFNYYNEDRPEHEIDLHGLYVAQALEYLQRKINECRSKNILQLKVITGVGNHSQHNIARIKPRVENFAHKNHLTMTVFHGHIILELTRENEYYVNNHRNNNDCTIL